MKALLTNYRQSPQKVRLVADLIRGKSVPAARIALTFLAKKSSPAMLKLLDSAVANSRSTGIAVEDLFVKTITVDKGSVLHRFMPKARGRASRFAKTMSIVALELGSKTAPIKKASKKVAKTEKVEVTEKKAASKKRTAKKAAAKAE